MVSGVPMASLFDPSRSSPPTPKVARISEGKPMWYLAPGIPMRVIATAAKRAKEKGQSASLPSYAEQRPINSHPMMTGGQH
jgi:hypothetical protein